MTVLPFYVITERTNAKYAELIFIYTNSIYYQPNIDNSSKILVKNDNSKNFK